MKKVAIYMMMLVGLVGFTACGGGIEGDAKAMAEKKCECEKLEKDEKADDLKKCRDQFSKLAEDMGKKYEDKKDDKDLNKKAEEAYEAAYKACSSK
ncbi:MAG: hypothetical protein KF690_11150 [Bacteroidetes bacterium]|nr:hypothetical protein [Bacteroidota bacterium]